VITASHYFVTGTDTGIGKTVATCALIAHLVARGRRVVGMKPIAAGLIEYAGDWQSEDTVAHAAVANVHAPLHLRQPVSLPQPIAPHIAAKHSGLSLSIDDIVAAARSLEERSDCVIAEGAGGLLVPINEQHDTRDLALALGYPIVLVVGMRLGCLNHALLTTEALAARQLALAGWIANEVMPDMPAFADNVATLERRIAAPRWATWRYGQTPSFTH
jgi:dethiobiotin synthetase